MPYKRILLKLSGEALMGNRTHGVDPLRIKAYCKEINELVKTGVEIAIVIGGEIFLEDYPLQVMVWIEFKLTTWEC